MRRSVLIRFIAVATFMVIATICLVLLTTTVAVQAAGDADAGKALYAKKCKTCHGAAGEGNAALAKTLQVTIAHLGSKDIQQKKDDDLKKAITDGTGKMKPVKDLSAADVANVMAFMRTLKQ